MGYDLSLSKILKKEGWKVKIRNDERLEEPHVTIIRKCDVWRLSLRTDKFLEAGQGWQQIDKGVRAAIEAKWETLQQEWDAFYPHNPISSENDEQDD